MRKASIAILAMLYLITASGVVVNMHYCMGSMASVGYGYDTHDVCGKCGMTEKKGCCHTEYKIVKVDDARQQAQVAFEMFAADAAMPLQAAYSSNERFDVHKRYALQYHSPPDKRANSVYLHTSVFRI